MSLNRVKTILIKTARIENLFFLKKNKYFEENKGNWVLKRETLFIVLQTKQPESRWSNKTFEHSDKDTDEGKTRISWWCISSTIFTVVLLITRRSFHVAHVNLLLITLQRSNYEPFAYICHLFKVFKQFNHYMFPIHFLVLHTYFNTTSSFLHHWICQFHASLFLVSEKSEPFQGSTVSVVFKV